MKAEDSFGPSGRAPHEKDFRGGCALSDAAPVAWIKANDHNNIINARQWAHVLPKNKQGEWLPLYTAPTLPAIPLSVLREHWLHAMECDHETKQDKPHCSCSQVDLGWHPSVGAAVEAWLEHVIAADLLKKEQK